MRPMRLVIAALAISLTTAAALAAPHKSLYSRLGGKPAITAVEA